MELYTSLVRLKQAMNGGQMPPMTPVPESVQHLIDPAFTIGLGGLTEDVERGLRCPVRDCGDYFHRLAPHLNASHADVGGEQAVKRALSIPMTAKLYSQAFCNKCRENSATTLVRYRSAVFTPAQRTKGVRRAAVSNRTVQSRTTIGSRNLRDRCVAQLSHKLIDLQNTLGRSPSSTEFGEYYGYALLSDVRLTFGTWNNAKAHCGLEAYEPGGRSGTRSRERVIDGLAAWYHAHGSLPSASDAQGQRRTPLLPCYQTILNALKTESWSEAMRRAASLLNIYGGRYGLPERKTA